MMIQLRVAQGNSKLSKARSAKGGSSEPEPEIQEGAGGPDGDFDLKIGEEFSQANAKPVTVDDFELLKVRQLALDLGTRCPIARS